MKIDPNKYIYSEWDSDNHHLTQYVFKDLDFDSELELEQYFKEQMNSGKYYNVQFGHIQNEFEILTVEKLEK